MEIIKTESRKEWKHLNRSIIRKKKEIEPVNKNLPATKKRAQDQMALVTSIT